MHNRFQCSFDCVYDFGRLKALRCRSDFYPRFVPNRPKLTALRSLAQRSAPVLALHRQGPWLPGKFAGVSRRIFVPFVQKPAKAGRCTVLQEGHQPAETRIGSRKNGGISRAGGYAGERYPPRKEGGRTRKEWATTASERPRFRRGDRRFRRPAAPRRLRWPR